MEQNRPKDPMVLFRNLKRGHDKKVNALNPEGGERFELYLTQEQAAVLRDAIDSCIENPLGVKLDMHVSKKENAKNGNVFDSAYLFVKNVEEAPAHRGPARFVPKGAPTAKTFDRTAKIHKELAD